MRWSLTHDAQQGRDHLEAQGELPPAFSSILSQSKAKQHDADANVQGVDFIFDVPVELAQSLVGYRHDRDILGLSGKVFSALDAAVSGSSASPKKASLWKRLFGV